MVSWAAFEQAEPEFAATARTLLGSHRHLTVATLRLDGSPRISGTELVFAGGDLWLGMMPESRKLADLRRDRRCSVHSGSDDPPEWEGDAKLDALADIVDDPAAMRPFVDTLEQQPDGPFSAARLDITRMVLTGLGDPPDHLIVAWWTPEGGLQQAKR
jgi:hypothetical protein